MDLAVPGESFHRAGDVSLPRGLLSAQVGPLHERAGAIGRGPSPLRGVARDGEAEELLRECLALREKAHPDGSPPARTGGADRKRQALERIVQLHRAWDAAEPGKGHDEKARAWQARQ
jgi:hypothetical protein